MIPVLILARGGSKRLPGKNLKSLCGKPLLQYSVEAALGFSENVYVSSDSQKILEIANNIGAKTILRPDELAQDYITSEKAAVHFLYEIDHNGPFVLVQPTSPFVTTQYIKEGYQLYLTGIYDSVVSICKITGVYYIFEKNRYEVLNFKNKHAYQQNGAFYVADSKNILDGYSFSYGEVGFYTMPKEDSIDIDTEYDFFVAEQIMQERLNKARNER